MKRTSANRELIHEMCVRQKVKMNGGESNGMVFERREVVVCDFGILYRVSVPAVGRCEVVMDKVSEFKYLGTVLSKNRKKWSMEK